MAAKSMLQKCIGHIVEQEKAKLLNGVVEIAAILVTIPNDSEDGKIMIRYVKPDTTRLVRLPHHEITKEVKNFFQKMVNTYIPDAIIVSCVVDSFDIKDKVQRGIFMYVETVEGPYGTHSIDINDDGDPISDWESKCPMVMSGELIGFYSEIRKIQTVDTDRVQ